MFEGFLEFSCIEDAYSHVLELVLKRGIHLPEQNSIEIFGVAFKVAQPSPSTTLLRLVGTPLSWAEKEFKERINRRSTNPGNAWKEWKEFWEPKLVQGKFDYTYSERWTPQLDALIAKLKDNPTTRRAVLLTYYPEDIHMAGRVPCTVASQYVIRRNKLNALYFLRSSDTVNLLPADLYHYIRLQQWLSDKLKISIGTFGLIIGSLHIYYKDKEKASLILQRLRR